MLVLLVFVPMLLLLYLVYFQIHTVRLGPLINFENESDRNKIRDIHNIIRTMQLVLSIQGKQVS